MAAGYWIIPAAAISDVSTDTLSAVRSFKYEQPLVLPSLPKQDPRDGR